MTKVKTRQKSSDLSGYFPNKSRKCYFTARDYCSNKGGVADYKLLPLYAKMPLCTHCSVNNIKYIHFLQLTKKKQPKTE